MQRICRTLSRQGYEVKLIGRIKKTSVGLAKFEFDTHRLSCFFESGAMFYAEYNLRLFLYLLKANSDAISAVDLDTILACRMASWLKHKPLFFDAHELFTEVPELKNKRTIKKIWAAIGRIFISRKINAYTVNDSLATLLSSLYDTEFQSIYNYPLKSESTTSDTIEGHVKILYQGMVNQGRGLIEVIDAIKDQDDFALDIIGTGDIYQEVQTSIKNSKTKINLSGFIPPKDLPHLTSKYHIGINLLDRESGNYYHSSANKFFDYIMAGLPIISMDFPEYRKVVDQYEVGVLIPDLKPESILAAVQQIVSDYSHYRNNCLKARQFLHWESQEKQLIDLYSSVLES